MAREAYGSNSEPVYEKPNWKCSAYGCDLPGGLSPGFGQEARYYCRFHYGKEPHQNDSITKVLHGFRGLFDAIYAIRAVEDIPKVANVFDRMGRQDLLPTVEEKDEASFYKSRLLYQVGKEVFEKIQKQ